MTLTDKEVLKWFYTYSLLFFGMRWSLAIGTVHNFAQFSKKNLQLLPHMFDVRPVMQEIGIWNDYAFWLFRRNFFFSYFSLMRLWFINLDQIRWAFQPYVLVVYAFLNKSRLTINNINLDTSTKFLIPKV